MKEAIRKTGEVLEKFNNVLELIAGLTAFLFMVLLCFQVLMRYVFANPIYGIDEFVIALMIYLCAIGWCTCYWQNGHAILEFIVKRLGRGPRRIIFHCINLSVLAISVVFIPASLKLFQMQKTLRPVGGLPFGRSYYYALPVIIMSIIMMVYSLYKTIAFIVLDDERIVVPEAREEGNAID